MQAHNATLDVEVSNIESLIDELKDLREQWKQIYSEAKTVATQFGISAAFPTKRKTRRKCFSDETSDEDSTEKSEETAFQHNVYNVLLDSVIPGLTVRYKAVCEINGLFSFLWQYRTMPDELLEERTTQFIKKYSVDVSEHLLQEVKQLKSIHTANFGTEPLSLIELLNKLHKYNLKQLFPNCCIALRIFCTIPVTVTEAEGSFSILKLAKNYLRTTMTEGRLFDLAILAIEIKLPGN